MKAPFDIFCLQVATYTVKNKIAFLSNQKHKHITSFIEKECSEILNKYSKIDYIPSGKIPKKIWVLWYQTNSEIPLVPRKCMERLRKLKGFEVIFLDENNISDYVDISDIKGYLDSGELFIQGFADIVRMRLLRRYGGIWLDSTMAVLSEDKFYQLMDTLSFFTIKSKVEPMWRFVAYGKWSTFCWAGTCDNPFFACIDDCMTYFLKKNGGFFEYLHMDYTINACYKNVPFIKNMIDTLPSWCENTSLIARKINEPYEESFYCDYIEHNPLCKLTYKDQTPIERTENNSLTYWGKIMEDWKD